MARTIEVVLHACYGGIDFMNASSNIKVCVNSELRRPAVNSVKRGRVFVIQTLNKVDSAVRVTILPGTAFLRINGL